jgi:hypothetical protein
MNSREEAGYMRRRKASFDPDILAVMEASGALKTLLQRLDAVFMRVLEGEEEQIGTGNRMFAFLEVERFIRELFDSVGINPPEQGYVFLTTLLDERDPVYLRGFLLRLILLLRELAEQMKSLGDVVCDGVAHAFDNLRVWFGFVDLKALRSEL